MRSSSRNQTQTVPGGRKAGVAGGGQAAVGCQSTRTGTDHRLGLDRRTGAVGGTVEDDDDRQVAAQLLVGGQLDVRNPFRSRSNLCRRWKEAMAIVKPGSVERVGVSSHEVMSR